MTIQSEHHRMKPVLDLARQLDIATNPDPSAIFEAGSGGFQIWCTPEDHPEGWTGIVMNPGLLQALRVCGQRQLGLGRGKHCRP
jgi:hypothetical protein